MRKHKCVLSCQAVAFLVVPPLDHCLAHFAPITTANERPKTVRLVFGTAVSPSLGAHWSFSCSTNAPKPCWAASVPSAVRSLRATASACLQRPTASKPASRPLSISSTWGCNYSTWSCSTRSLTQLRLVKRTFRWWESSDNDSAFPASGGG